MNQWQGILVFLLVLQPVLGAQNHVAEEQRARETLRNTILERERSGAAPATNLLTADLRAAPAFMAMEGRYLAGQITARQFQKFIRELRVSPPIFTAATTNSPQQEKAIAVLRSLKEGEENTPAPPVASLPADKGSAVPMTLSDIEAKVDELLRKKANRTRQVETNAIPADLTDPQSPLTKRQRLDTLLRLYIDGALDEATYQAKRAQVVSEP